MDAEKDAEAELRAVLELIARERRAMLERIGAALNVGNPEAVYRRIVGESGSATTRERLAAAWAAVGKAHEDAVARAVDGLLRVRRAGAPGSGGGPRAYPMMQEAVVAQEKLDAEVRAVTGTAHSPAAHFWYALRTVFGETAPPSFTLGECMAFAGKVAGRELGLELSRELSGTGGGRVSFAEAGALFRAVGEAVGQVRGEQFRAAWFELWAYHPDFAGDYGRLKLAERRAALLELVVAAVLEQRGAAGEDFALLDNRFGVGSWCTLADVARHLLRGGAAQRLREQMWCCERMPGSSGGGGTIFAFYEASGQLKQS